MTLVTQTGPTGRKRYILHPLDKYLYFGKETPKYLAPTQGTPSPILPPRQRQVACHPNNVMRPMPTGHHRAAQSALIFWLPYSKGGLNLTQCALLIRYRC